MADKILYVQSAFKHGYTQDDIEHTNECPRTGERVDE